MLSSSCTSPYVQRVLIPVLLSHTVNICQSETRQRLYSFSWIKSLPFFSYGTSKVSSDSYRRTLSDMWRWPCCFWERACVQMCKRACANDYKGRIWDALGKTNTDSDRCQQHLSDLHFLIANELPKKHLTSTDRQHDTETSSTWRRKCFHRNIYGRLRKLLHKPTVPWSLPECIQECKCMCTYIHLQVWSLCTSFQSGMQDRKTTLCTIFVYNPEVLQPCSRQVATQSFPETHDIYVAHI